jgi:hypothetical protein
MSRWTRWLDPRTPGATVTSEPGGWSRRAVLRGAGALITLPPLASLLTREEARAAGRPETPWIAISLPNGRHLDAWTPTGTGSGYTTSHLLEPFEDIRHKMAVITGLANVPADDGNVGTHAREAACWLTCNAITPLNSGPVTNAWSVDQLLAQSRAGLYPVPSVTVCSNDSPNDPSVCTNYSCQYYASVSWRGNTPVLPLVGAQNLWRALFAREVPLGPAAGARRAAWRGSVLQGVQEDAAALDRRLGSADRQRLEAYLDGISELERRLANTTPSGEEVPPLPAFSSVSREVRATMLEMVRIAIEGGQTSVATAMLASPGGGPVWRELGHDDDQHSISHHGFDATKMAEDIAINRIESEIVADFIRSLDATPGTEEGRSLLDESVVYVGSGHGDSNRHDFVDLPALLFGTGGGRLRTGARWHLEAPLANLHLTTLRAAGLSLAAHGDSTGALDDLLV